MKQTQLEELASGKILPLLLHYAWPALITTTLNLMYNVVDRIFVGNVCGADAIAGLSLTFPIMSVIAAVGVLIGAGSGAVISIFLGEKRMADAERALGQCVAMKGIFGIVMPPLMIFFFLDPILRMMVGGDGVAPETLDAARLYLNIVIPFSFFSHLAFGLSNCMRAEGSPKQSMYCMLVGFGINLILDPIFIYGFGWGIAGAAWATNIAMTISCLVAFRYYLSGHSALRLHWRTVRMYKDLAPRVLAIGLSPFLMQFAGSIINFALNNAFAQYAPTREFGTIQIAAFGIAQTVMMIFLMPTMGIQQGVGPIIGYNWGARNAARVLSALKLGIILISAICVFGCFMQLWLATPLSRCFASAPDVVSAGAFGLRIGCCMIWCIGVNVTANVYFQSIGRPRTAILLSLLRQVLCLLPCVWILPMLMPARPVLAIWLAMPISDVLAFVATIPPLSREIRRLRAGRFPASSAA